MKYSFIISSRSLIISQSASFCDSDFQIQGRFTKPSWECVFVFHKHLPYLQGNKEDIDITAEEFKSFSDGFWNISPHSKKNGHPAPFPEDLIYRLIKFYTYKGNIVLDMFAGSGTVGIVALRTERHFVCIDISKQYTELAERRIDEVRKQGKIEVPIRSLEKYR